MLEDFAKPRRLTVIAEAKVGLMHDPTMSRDITFIEGSDEILNSTRKTTDFKTILYMEVINRYLKFVVERNF